MFSCRLWCFVFYCSQWQLVFLLVFLFVSSDFPRFIWTVFLCMLFSPLPLLPPTVVLFDADEPWQIGMFAPPTPNFHLCILFSTGVIIAAGVSQLYSVAGLCWDNSNNVEAWRWPMVDSKIFHGDDKCPRKRWPKLGQKILWTNCLSLDVGHKCWVKLFVLGGQTVFRFWVRGWPICHLDYSGR